MEIITGLLIGLFFLVAVPWAAFSARSRSLATEARIGMLEGQLAALRADFAALRPDGGRPAAAVAEEQSTTAEAAADAAAEPAAATAPGNVDRVREPEPAPVPAEAPAPAGPADETATAATSPEAMADRMAAPEAIPETAAAPPPRRDLEEILGTRWTVWVGALALGLGGIFLVRYSIEAGFFGPAARLSLAGLFGLALVGLGEAARRGLFSTGRLPALPGEHAPLALTAAGCATLFGAVYAAYAVYGFLAPTAAFATLALVAGGALGASLLHGQALAGVGLVGGFVTPALVGGDARSLWPLAIYLVLLGASALALNRRFAAVWLNFAALAGFAGWILLLAVFGRQDAGPLLFLAAAALALFVLAQSWLKPPQTPRLPVGDEVALLSIGALAVLLGLAFLKPDMPIGPVAATFLGASALLVATALRDPRIVFGAPLAVILALGAILTWPAFQGGEPWFLRVINGWRLAPSATPHSTGILTVFAALAISLFLAAPAFAAWRGSTSARHSATGRSILSFAGGLGAPLVLMAAAIRAGGLVQEPRVAALFVLLAIIGGLTALRLLGRAAGEREANVPDAAGHAAGAALSVGLAIAFALPGLWMAVGFAIAAALTARLQRSSPMPGLRQIAGSFATAALMRGVLSPVLATERDWAILNSQFVAYGLPLAALAVAGWHLRRDVTGRPVRPVEFAAVAFAAALVGLTIVHTVFMAIDAAHAEFHASWLFALWGLPFVVAGLWLRYRDGGWPAHAAVTIGVLFAVGGAGFGLLAAFNPLWDGSLVWGWLLINRLTVGYFVALLSVWLAGNLLRETSIGLARGFFAIAALLGALLVVTQIRLFFHGADLADGWRIGLAEAGCYVVWLLLLTALALIASDDTSPVRRMVEWGANLLALGTLGALALVHANPFRGYVAGALGPLDESFAGYLATGVGFALLAHLGRIYPSEERSVLVAVNRWVAIGLGYLFLLVQIRRGFVGLEHVAWMPISDGEHYALSLVTLLYGVALLGLGLALRSREVRIASAVFVTLAVAKVFLFDMAGLSGLWRPVSFIGLGAVLIGIGMAYQRLLFRRAAPAAADQPQATPST